MSVFFCNTPFSGHQDGTVLSVRRFPDGQIEENLFKAETEMLGRVRHQNLTILRGYYVHGDVRLLIYDYMPNGNLTSLLQEASQQGGHALNWPMRHLIALGVAQGLSFLHTHCDPPIIHGDVKPNNVQFDADFEAHLSDFGLERFTATPTNPSSSSNPVGSMGYVSPETGNSGQLTREADVYSFGIVLCFSNTSLVENAPWIKRLKICLFGHLDLDKIRKNMLVLTCFC